MNRSRKKSGFTLIELLVVVAIIALLVAILLPSLAKAKQMAKSILCGSHHKAAGMGWALYANLYDGKHMHHWDRSAETATKWGVGGGTSLTQAPYSWWYFVLGETPPGPTYKSGWWNVTTERYESAGPFNRTMCNYPEKNNNPNYRCTEADAQDIQGGPDVTTNYHWNATSMTTFNHEKNWGTQSSPQWSTQRPGTPTSPPNSDDNYYPRADLFTHPGSTGLVTCWSRYDGPSSSYLGWAGHFNSSTNRGIFPSGLHGGRNQVVFGDGHVDTMDPEEMQDNVSMWRPELERGED